SAAVSSDPILINTQKNAAAVLPNAPCQLCSLVDSATDVRFTPIADIPQQRLECHLILKTRRKVVTIVLAWSVRVDANHHQPADIVTSPVLYRPIARATAGDRSMSLPRTHGPPSLMRTVTHPLWQTRI